MKLLLDENISYRILGTLEEVYPGTAHVTRVQPALMSDSAIWQYARKEAFVLVTFDHDFVQLAALHGGPPKVLLLTLRNPRHSEIASVLVLRKEQIERFVESTGPDSPNVMEIAG